MQLLCVGDMNAPNVTFSYIVPTAAGRDLHREHEWQRLDRQYMWRETHEWYVCEHARTECVQVGLLIAVFGRAGVGVVVCQQ